MRLGDLDRPHRRRKPGSRAHPIPDLVEVALARSVSNASRSCPSTPGAPLLALTCRHASQTNALGIANGLSFGPWHASSLPPRASRPRLNESTFLMSRPLRSTTTPASSGFTANTGRSASERRDRYSMPPVSAVGTLPLATSRGPASPDAAFDARLLTFRARAADQAHAAFTPGTTWPATRAPARLIPREQPNPPVSMPPNCAFDASTTTPTPNPGPGALERLPGPHLTRSSRAFSLDRSPRRSSANAAPGWFDAYPRRADAGGSR